MLALLGVLYGASGQMDEKMFEDIMSGRSQQFGRKAAGNKAPAVKSDLKYIKCQVCETIVKHSLKTVKTLREELKAHEKVCNSGAINCIDWTLRFPSPFGSDLVIR